MDLLSYEIKIIGIIQGVGFRPFVYNLANSLGLTGWVGNVDGGVVIVAEGKYDDLQGFVERLGSEAPPLAHIKAIDVSGKPYCGFKTFSIIESSKSSSQNIYISPDVSICDECKSDLFNKENPRFLYPFINCSNCGPRFTIVKGIPYDRCLTTMDKFDMCPKCRLEYNDPSDRRYFAQPISCFECGPELSLLDGKGERVDVRDIMDHVCHLLLEGRIVAIKGIGGYHLACNAMDGNAVAHLRKRKIRDEKPFALMVKDYETALKYCIIDDVERKILESERKPIVLMRRRDGIKLPKGIACKNPNLGIMLPYTPLHLLLFNKPGLEALVMTSGNRSNEPIYYKDGDAIENLRDIADYFLVNNREIHIRTDDSVTRVFMGKEYIIRRSRGYTPLPVTCRGNGLDFPTVLACGGQLKNTFCLNRGEEFYLSHHIGDLENFETLASFEEGIRHFGKILNLDYRVVAYDLHPGYISTQYALSLENVEKFPVQHHHAHIASCMAENSLEGEVIGVAFDGTGYGEDGNIWGGEFFTGGYRGFERAIHLDYVRMPGGEMAVKEPWRMAVSYLYDTFDGICDKIDSEYGINIGGINVLGDIEARDIKTAAALIEKGFNSPLTSSMGRFFDAVSSLIGIRSKISYEGQAAIELENESQSGDFGAYSFLIKSGDEISKVDSSGIIKGILEDMSNGVSRGIIAARFHETIVSVVLEGCLKIRGCTGLSRVALSGGVFQNMRLLKRCLLRLREKEFEVFIHGRVPPNDGGIALGQAVMAAVSLAK